MNFTCIFICLFAWQKFMHHRPLFIAHESWQNNRRNKKSILALRCCTNGVVLSSKIADCPVSYKRLENMTFGESERV